MRFMQASAGSSTARTFRASATVNAETAAAVFRLFAAARGGMAHEETIVPPHAKTASACC